MDLETAEKRARRGAAPSGSSVTATPKVLTYAAPDNDRLESWKEIAAFIGRDERTAMRWAKDLGMPVQRIPGIKRSRVSASRGDISAWLRRAEPSSGVQVAVTEVPSPATRYPRKFVIAGAITLCSIAALAALVDMARVRLQPRLLPARVIFGESSFEVRDVDNHHLWTHQFGRPFDFSLLESDSPEKLVRIADLRNNGDREVVMVAAFRLGDNPTDTPYSEVDCFSGAGKLLWSYVPSERFRFGEHDLQGPWIARALLLTNSGPKHALWAALTHYEWGNSYVANLDVQTGRPTLRYVNTGTIRSLAELRTPRATYLVVGGFNNEYDGASLALMNEQKRFAASPQTAGTRHKCLSCPDGVPEYYFVLPRSEVNQIRRVYEDSVHGIVIEGADFTTSAAELGHATQNVRTIYRFHVEPAIIPISVRYSSPYDMLHRELERTHQVNHRLEECPERLHPRPIKMWTPAAGWTEIHLPATPFDH